MIGSEETAADDAAAAAPALRGAYDAETAAIVRRRLPSAAAIYMVAIGLYGVIDVRGHPEHLLPLTLRLVSHALICLLGLGVIRTLRTAVRVRHVAAAFAAALTLAGTVYNASVGMPAERYAMYLVCLLTGMAVLFPWGWGCQAVGAAASVAAYVLAVPFLGERDGLAHGGLALVVASGTTVFGALFLDRSRFAAFVQTALQREEAEVTAALVAASEMLNARLHEPDMVDRVNGLVLELIGCDVTITLIWDATRKTFDLRAVAGIDAPAASGALRQLGALGVAIPIARRLRAGEVLELEDGAQGLLPPGFLGRFGVASVLVVPISCGPATLGMMLHARRGATPPFVPKQRRLALGIAHAVAIALENARLIADLQTASRLKSEFVSTMSHELRTPINVILGFTEMAGDHGLGEAERERCLARIDAAGRDLLSLVEDTLEIGRMEAGRDEVALRPVPFQALWSQLGEVAARLPRADGVALLWSETVPGVALLTDPRKLTVIVRNLVGNALKFTERGWVRADAEIEIDALVLRIADTGIGIRPEDQQVIFEMFRQADGSDSRQFGGVGLGLHIVRRTVEQLGGTLALDSSRGRGSVFTVRLPVGPVPLRRAA